MKLNELGDLIKSELKMLWASDWVKVRDVNSIDLVRYALLQRLSTTPEASSR